jgi:hypothetical protein
MTFGEPSRLAHPKPASYTAGRSTKRHASFCQEIVQRLAGQGQQFLVCDCPPPPASTSRTCFPRFVEQYLVVIVVKGGGIPEPFPAQRVRPRQHNHLLCGVVPAVEERLKRARVQRLWGHLVFWVGCSAG